MTGGRLIKEARRRAHLSQAELARRLGTRQPAVARWETGAAAPSFDTVMRALRACGLEAHVQLSRISSSEARSIQSSLSLTPGQRLARNRQMLETERWASRARPVKPQ